jgi:hypothetical protein
MLYDTPPEPWLSFPNAIDVGIDEPVDLHCMGGFAVAQAYGLGRATADIDVLSVVPYSSGARLMELAGPTGDGNEKKTERIQALWHRTERRNLSVHAPGQKPS